MKEAMDKDVISEVMNDLYQAGEMDPNAKQVRGLRRRSSDRTQTIINAFRGAKADTIVHELGHVFLDEIEMLIRSGEANERLRKDWVNKNGWH